MSDIVKKVSPIFSLMALGLLGLTNNLENEPPKPTLFTNNQTEILTPTIHMGCDTLLANTATHCYLNQYAALAMDANSGEVLASYNPHKPLYPASLVKMMTILLALEKLDDGSWQPNTPLKAKKFYSATPRLVKLDLKENQQITAQQAIFAAFIISAADGAQTLAGNIAGSPSAFVTKMNEKAAALGMCNTHFTDAVGDYGPKQHPQKSTAYDMALLAQVLNKKYANYSQLLAAPHVYWPEKNKTYNNHALTPYLKRRGMVWGKTGFLKTSSNNLAGSFCDNADTLSTNLLIVTFGAKSAWDRAHHTADFLATTKQIVENNKFNRSHLFGYAQCAHGVPGLQQSWWQLGGPASVLRQSHRPFLRNSHMSHRQSGLRPH
jgi:D-alanyl-D-alanine carboxypeptidase